MVQSNKFRGVRQRQWGSWVSEIRHPLLKKRIWLGTFETAEEAARAYDEASILLSGQNAKTNFPVVPSTTTSKDHEFPLSTLSDNNILGAKLRKCCKNPAASSITCLRLDNDSSNIGVWQKRAVEILTNPIPSFFQSQQLVATLYGVAPPSSMYSVLIPAQESCFLLRILNGSSQTIDSLKDKIFLYFTQYYSSKSNINAIDSRTLNNDQNEKKEISDDEGKPTGAVFNVLDEMLKSSLDRLKTTRDSIAWVHRGSSDAILEASYRSDITVIRALCMEAKLGAALCLWNKLVQQFRIPDLLTHNCLLNALCKSGDLAGAERLVRNMLYQGPSPTCATYNTLMNGYCLVNEVDKALDLFSTMTNHKIRPNRVSCNILVHALCQKGLLENARKLLEEILGDNNDGETSDLITTTILMDGYFKNGNSAEALTCWNDVLERGMELDIIAYNVIVRGFCLSGNMNLVYKCLCEMFKSGYVPDIFTYNTLIGKLCKAGRMDEACYVFNVMSRMEVPPDDITYKMIIQGLCINGDPDKANEFLSHMLGKSIMPKPLIWNVIIYAYGKSGDVQKALSVKDQMIEFDILPNIYTYNALIYTHLRNGSIDKAHYLKKEMLLNDIFPDLVTYNLLIGAACNLGQISSALQLHDEMLRRGCDPDIVTYTELIRCYCARGNVEKAEERFFKVRRSGLPIDHVPFLILMKKYFKIKELDKVFDLYLIWSTRGI
ncbi:hypothetical protein RD792_001764 [Penstemon davidsonii]|uniref:AP2/ERF domain-containing protein n=1 Tax=Penstemon davidsonii TaxID=160366 RepID=A0ABR0DP84_9LAMI|nr:hypothetical protein RD792_001764 [Penstemon davidsonii]